MNVLHLAAGELSRGASRGAISLHRGLLDLGLNSRFLTTDPNPRGIALSGVAGGFSGQLGLQALKQLDRLPLRFYRFDRRGTLSPGWAGLPIQAMPGFDHADLVHLHWVNDGLLDFRSLSRCKKPIVWTVRDMWPITGLCHYPQACTRHESGCGHCPLVSDPGWPWPDPSHYGYKRKLRWLSNAPITYVGISPWVAHKLRSSPITAGKDVEMIWNSINSRVFQPMPRVVARHRLGLDSMRGPLLLAEWRSPRSEPWKGFGHVVDLFPQLRDMGCNLLLFGRMPPELSDFADADGVYNLGHIDNDEQLRCLYSAADVFVCPTLQEAFGKTMAEAMACGTPVAAFDQSAPADLIESGITGALASPADSSSLLHAIQFLLSQTDWSAAHCAERARQRFGQNGSARAYANLYERLCASTLSCIQQA